MAEKIINNPSLLPGDLAIELSGNAITAISGHPLIGTGGGTQSDYVYYPDFDETTGNIEFKLGTIDYPPSPIGGWHISGADGATGPQGEPGNNGKTPTFQINSENAHWEWKYTDDVAWIDTHVVASGAVGPKGEKGDKGDDGISPTVSTSVIDGGNRVTFTYGAGSSTYIDVMSGAPGAPGAKGEDGQKGTDGKDGKDGTNGKDGVSPTVSSEQVTGGTKVTFTYGMSQTETITVLNGTPGAEGASGYSPTVSTEAVTAEGHPQGGTKVTITDLEHQSGQEFYVWNGTNGQGATVNLLDGDGIHITNDGTNYTIGVSANYSAMAVTWVQDQHYLTNIPNDYALKTDVEAASANALSEAESWVENKHYLTAVPDSYATKTYVNEASANALGQAQSWVETEGYLKAVPAEYATKTYANEASANAYDKAVAQIPNVDNFITKDVDDLTYYYKKTETSGSTELSTEFAKKVNNPDTSLTDKYLVLRTDTNGAVSGWCNFNDKIYSKTESDGRYMQKNTDSTLSGDGTTNSPLGIDSDNFYELDTAGNYLTSQTSNQKTIISTTPALDNAISRVSTSADVWDTVTAKSTVTVNTANNEIKVNNNANSAISAVSYDICEVGEPDLIPQKMIVGTSSGAFVSYVTGGKCNGMGTLFFWLESQQPWNPVNE